MQLNVQRKDAKHPLLLRAMAAGVAQALGFKRSHVTITHINGEAVTNVDRRLQTDGETSASAITFEVQSYSEDAAAVDDLKQNIKTVATSGALVANVQLQAVARGILTQELKDSPCKLPSPTLVELVEEVEVTVQELVTTVPTVAPTVPTHTPTARPTSALTALPTSAPTSTNSIVLLPIARQAANTGSNTVTIAVVLTSAVAFLLAGVLMRRKCYKMKRKNNSVQAYENVIKQVPQNIVEEATMLPSALPVQQREVEFDIKRKTSLEKMEEEVNALLTPSRSKAREAPIVQAGPIVQVGPGLQAWSSPASTTFTLGPGQRRQAHQAQVQPQQTPQQERGQKRQQQPAVVSTSNISHRVNTNNSTAVTMSGITFAQSLARGRARGRGRGRSGSRGRGNRARGTGSR